MPRLRTAAAGLVALALAATAGRNPAARAADPAISWKKTDLDPAFRSEGAAAADVNKDGKKDVMVGEFWYEAPDWKRHEMQKSDAPGGFDPKRYSKVFACWADDFNADGFPDLLVIDFPGAPCYWLENPKGDANTHWKRHIVWHSACNETPQYADLLGTGKRVLIMGAQPKPKEGEKAVENMGQMAYFTPNPTDPTALWTMHPISTPSVAPEVKDGKPVPGTGKQTPGTFKFAHGLGVGDLNGDGKMDVLTIGGWWEQPAKADGVTPWAFHPYSVTDACSDMFAADLDGDGKPDVLNTSAHKYGIWWHKQRPAGADGHPTFEKKDLFPKLVAETHAAHFVDIDGDGLKDLVTGKRKHSHYAAEPDSEKPATTYWLKAKKSADGIVTFDPQLIDEDGGIGTQFEVTDLNGDGLLDVVASNKLGVRVIVQQRK